MEGRGPVWQIALMGKRKYHCCSPNIFTLFFPSATCILFEEMAAFPFHISSAENQSHGLPWQTHCVLKMIKKAALLKLDLFILPNERFTGPYIFQNWTFLEAPSVTGWWIASFVAWWKKMPGWYFKRTEDIIKTLVIDLMFCTNKQRQGYRFLSRQECWWNSFHMYSEGQKARARLGTEMDCDLFI